VKKIVWLILVAAVGAAGWFAWAVLTPVEPSGQTFVLLHPGSSTRRIASELKNAGVIRSEEAFVLLHYVHHGHSLKAGEYLFDKPSNILNIQKRLQRGDVYFHTVVVPEGFTMFDIAHAIEAAGLGPADDFLKEAKSDTALISVIVVNLWQNAPYVAVLLLAGLRSLPSEPVEAASIDGASVWQVFWHVTLPLLRPYILVALLLRTIFEFRAFDNIYVMTSGGPANATMSLSMFTYLASFVKFDLSLGAAASWLMLFMCLLLCLFFIAVIRRREAN